MDTRGYIVLFIPKGRGYRFKFTVQQLKMVGAMGCVLLCFVVLIFKC